MMNRLGEVSGSHRKVLNTFMKRNANLMKDEFEVLQKLLSQTKSIMSEFDEKRAPVVRCGSVLNTATQKVSSIRSADVSIETTEDQIVQAEKETQNMKAEIEAAKSSPEFSKAAAVSQKIEESRRHEKELRAQTVELFSHITRALTKYSYGVSKETEARLGVMSSEPWKLLYEDDLLPYSSLLSEVRKSIVSGSIQLKDSDRMVQYLDSILESLPGYQNKARSIRAELDSILQEDHSLFLKAREIEERIALRTEELARNKVYLEQQKKQNEERKKEVDSSLKEAQEILLQLTGRQYSISY
jgi:prophage DNA circulation protein